MVEMVELNRRAYRPDHVSPPGETLRETIEAWDMTQASLAERTGKTVKAINEIVQGKSAITPETALQLERVLGVPAAFWLNREARYQESRARAAESARLSADLEWVRSFPVRRMEAAGWLLETETKGERLQGLLSFFGVASVDAWNSLWKDVTALYRSAAGFSPGAGAVAAWLRRGELLAREIDTLPWDQAGFSRILRDIRRLKLDPATKAIPEAVSRCASVGVVLVVVPELPGTRLFGATRWLSPSRALVQLSRRYGTEDQLWFSFFHEAGHVLRHGKKEFFLEDQSRKSRAEDEADRFASDLLIPPRDLADFLATWDRSLAAVAEFAARIELAPGILVGRLQHDGHLRRPSGNGLKRRL